MKIVLASKSPRRKEILQNLGIDFDVITRDTDESSDIKDPLKLVEYLSFIKGKAVYEDIKDKDTLVISSDTVVTLDGVILGKPKDVNDAKGMLKMLSGKSHEVVSGVTLMYNDVVISEHEVTNVKFADLSDELIEKYVATLEPMDKAGSYAVQGLASLFIEGINGCYFNVVGFPVHLFAKMLKKIGIDPYSITNIK